VALVLRFFNKKSICICTGILLLLFVFAQLAMGARSSRSKRTKPASKATLNRQLRNVNQRIKSVQAQLHQTKVKQKNVTNQLIATQRRLEATQDKVTHNKVTLMAAQNKLKVINNRLSLTQKQLERRGKLLAGRMKDIYKGQDIGYLEVLLGSRDMRTFLSRSYYVKRIVNNDVDLIEQIKKDKAQVERDKRAQASEVKRIASIQAELIQQRDAVAGFAEEKQAQLDAIEHDQSLYERALQDLEAESNRIGAMIQRYQSTRKSKGNYKGTFTGGLGLPVSGRISCPFGYRIHPITRVHSMHTGVDIACPTGTPVHAAADGEVIVASWMGAYGNAVVIDHGGGVSTLYGHNSRLLVKNGQRVKKGQVIAKAGSTGWSTGPHCHFEKRVNGKPVNPL
jgi:murein DD-endopeptidase MepM/ murein hydrolase activator NlpD